MCSRCEPVRPTCLLLLLSGRKCQAGLPHPPRWNTSWLAEHGWGTHHYHHHHHHQSGTPSPAGGQATGPSLMTLARARLWHLWGWRKSDPSQAWQGGGRWARQSRVAASAFWRPCPLPDREAGATSDPGDSWEPRGPGGDMGSHRMRGSGLLFPSVWDRRKHNTQSQERSMATRAS